MTPDWENWRNWTTGVCNNIDVFTVIIFSGIKIRTKGHINIGAMDIINKGLWQWTWGKYPVSSFSAM